MSWVPSPSPRLSASYREVIPTVLSHVPGHAQGMPMTQSPMGAVAVPSGLSFGMPAAAAPPGPVPYQAPRPQTRQGSFTPAPGAQPSPVHRGQTMGMAQLNFPARLGSLNSIPYHPPGARDLAHQNRSWTPLPVPSVLADLERPQHQDDKLSHSLTMLPMDLIGSPAASPLGDLRMPNGFGAMGGVSSASPTSNGAAQDAKLYTHHPKQRSWQGQAPVPVTLNVYWQRPVTYDDQGRAQRSLGGNDLSWRQKFLKDVIGVYHVGIEVHGIEYTFGNYRAPGSKQIGDYGSGVYCHEPRRPGPHCVFKHGEPLGKTTVAAGQVEDMCHALGCGDWSKASYQKIHHNCVDFSRTLSAKLGASEIPTWCYRGAAIAKVMGYGGPDPEENSQELSTSLELAHEQQAAARAGPPEVALLQQPQRRPLGAGSMLPTPMVDPRQAPMDMASRSLAGTYVAPPPMPGPLPGGSLPGTYVAPPLSGTYVAPPGPHRTAPSQPPAPRRQEAKLSPNSRVSVLQHNGTWLHAKIVCQDACNSEDDSRFTVLYDNNWSTEVNVARNRIVSLPSDAPQDEGLPQAFMNEGFKMPVLQGLASADSILEPLKQIGKGLGVPGLGGVPRSLNGRPQPWQSAQAAQSPGQPRPSQAPAGTFTMGGYGPGAQLPQRPLVPPPSSNFHQQRLGGGNVRPMTGSFYPSAAAGGGYQAGARAPALVPQVGLQRSNAPRGRDTLGSTWRFS